MLEHHRHDDRCVHCGVATVDFDRSQRLCELYSDSFLREPSDRLRKVLNVDRDFYRFTGRLDEFQSLFCFCEAVAACSDGEHIGKAQVDFIRFGFGDADTAQSFKQYISLYNGR